MSGAGVTGLCRLRFRAPQTSFELAVPTDVPLVDLLPTVMGYAGSVLEEAGADHGGWVLQRLGGEPLDQELAPDVLGLTDGEVLYLRPRHDSLPVVHFDDLVDGVATALSERGDSWRPELTRRLAVALALTALALGAGVLLLHGPVRLRIAAAAAGSVLLLLGAGSASRAVGDETAGAALGAAAVPFAALAGLLLPIGHPGAADLTAARLLCGSSAALSAEVLALAAVGSLAAPFLGLILATLLVAVTGGLSVMGIAPGRAVALVAVVAVLLGAYLPSLSFRLSGLRMPALPRNVEELQEDVEPFPSGGVIARSAVAEAYLTSFYVTLGAVCAACTTVLAFDRDWPAITLAGVLSLVLLLHARGLGSTRQRLAVLLPGAYGGLLLAAGLALHLSGTERTLVVAGLFAAAAALTVVGWTMAGRRLLPYWGRIADLLHIVAAFSLLPLALDVVGLFHVLRAMNG